MKALSVGATIGILGGGQLGRMLAMAAAQLGFDTSIYCPQADSPAARIATHTTIGDYDDRAAMLDWASSCAVVTYEFENVPVAAVRALTANGIIVKPDARALDMAQDRLVEKSFLHQCGMDTVAFIQIDAPDALAPALEQFGGQGLLKTRHYGYDGKGQIHIKAGDKGPAIWEKLGSVPAILEACAPFGCEVSVIVARDIYGQTLCYDLSRNQHKNGVLRHCVVPAGLPEKVVEQARKAGRALADALDYTGILALELFVMEDGSLLANEFAPRVHNSGHWTVEACATGQFEQHIRAVCGWPLGSIARYHDVEMDNLLGPETENAIDILSQGGRLTLYGKRQPTPGRKMGHVVRYRGRAS